MHLECSLGEFMSTPIQTVENTIATKLREITGLVVYEVRPARALPLPSATLTLLLGRMHGGFPDTMQYLDILLQIDVWGRTESGMRDLADKVLMKLYQARTELGFIDIALVNARDFVEEDVWRRALDFRVETTVTKS